MPNYRALIEQVHNRNGPLEWGEDDVVAVEAVSEMWHINDIDDYDPTLHDILCGVLRRDMVARRLVVQHVSADSPPYKTAHWVKWALRGGTQEHEMGVSPDDDVLRAHLLAWLDAAGKLNWEPTQGP